MRRVVVCESQGGKQSDRIDWIHGPGLQIRDVGERPR
jgi:hypothetical protein